MAALALWGDSAMALEILSPRDGVSVAGDSVILIGSGATGSRVEWEAVGDTGRKQGAAKALSSGGFGGAVSLLPGRNRLRVGSREVEVFSVQKGAGAPDGFRPLRVHAGDISNCKDCHKVDLAVLGGGYPGVCLNCHVLEAENPKYAGEATDDRHFNSAGVKCGKCHDPHGSADPKLLLGSSQELCGTCHGRREEVAEAHPAYEEGGCMACHAPHFSGYDNQLSRTLPGVCQECHEQGTGGSAHEPVTDDASCTNCHDVHGANGTMTPVSAPALCTRCHDDVLEGGHGGELEDCLGCHDPHGDGGRVRATVSGTCTECHDGVADGQTVHPALEEGCDTCHSPHRDDNVARARVGCGECHDLGADQELASLHGRLKLSPGSCSACHPAHAARGDKLLLGKPHFPLSQGKCTACHTAGGGDFADVPADRCRTCHSSERDLTAAGATLHDPVAEGECATCHRPHLGSAGLLRNEQRDICGECHDVLEVGPGQMRHTATESCTDCHGPHGGNAEHFLVATGDALCLECHDDPAEAGGEVHPALEEGCQSCHSPHAGFAPGALVNPQPGLCLECHDDPTGSGPHGAGSGEQGCTACHDPHSSRNRALLRSDDCASCGAGKRGDGTSVQ